MARSKEYIINIAPIPWKRPRLKHKTFFDSQTQDKLFFGLHLNKQHGDDPKFDNPVHVDATFYMPIPKTLHKRKRTQWVSTFPDIDNLQKFIFDTLTQTGIWKDDCIVSSLVARKIYDKEPRTHIIITELE